MPSSINVRFDDVAYDGLRLFCQAQGVTVAGLVNALGEEVAGVDERRLPGWLRQLVARGRVIDGERRRRQG